jgi:hypothetical protein
VTVEKANWEMGFFSDWASFLKQDVFLENERVYWLFLEAYFLL